MADNMNLSDDDLELLTRARNLLERVYDPVIHQVAAVMRSETGQIYEGIHLGSRRINVCAESSAIANAEMANDGRIDTMVAVCKSESGEVVVTNPCGVCRELMTTYGTNANVIIDARGHIMKVPAQQLLPNPWMFPHENDWLANYPEEGISTQ